MVPDFLHKIKAKTYVKNLRHSSLHIGLQLENGRTEFGLCTCCSY